MGRGWGRRENGAEAEAEAESGQQDFWHEEDGGGGWGGDWTGGGWLGGGKGSGEKRVENN